MKHIKTFESYNINEAKKLPLWGKNDKDSSIKRILKAIVGVPLLGTLMGISNILPKKRITKAMTEQIESHLDIYHNLDTLEEYLLKFKKNTNDIDIQKNINDSLDEIESVRKKYPTLDDYKKGLNFLRFARLSNKKEIVSEIEKYQPKELSDLDLIRLIYDLTDFHYYDTIDWGLNTPDDDY